ncbi:MAG: TIGR04086 family membrane protein [Clostridia bacterium]|nr:TIGR04086 family membrane protein [Clostridia bacterium]
MESYQGNASKTIKNIGKGIGIAFISTIVFLLIFAIILTYTNVSENTITPVIIIVTAISILLRKLNWKWKD